MSRQLVLASFLSNICKALDLEVVSQQNIGYAPIWGGKKHRSIARWTLDFLIAEGTPLAEFLTGLAPESARFFTLEEQLSVLPDGWKGRAGRKYENPNHYANINPGDQTKLADIELTPNAWLEFYAKHDNRNSGALPFRIGEVFDAIVAALQARQWRSAFAALGVLIHYVSDACNPAHVNWWGRGDHTWEGGQGGPRARFHGVWDEPPGVREDNVRKIFGSLHKPKVKIADGVAACAAALDLKKDTLHLVDVRQFVMADDEDAGKSIAASREFCKSPAGARAVAKCIANGCATLLSLWQSAWEKALGPNARPKFADADVDDLNAEILDDPDSLPSIPLSQMIHGAAEPPAPRAAPLRRRRRRN